MLFVETLAIFLFVLSFIGAFFNFVWWWRPQDDFLMGFPAKIWDFLSSMPVAAGTFILGMLILFIWG